MRMESYSKLRENYFKILTTQPKAFNRKVGFFSNYADKSLSYMLMKQAESNLKSMKESGIYEMMNMADKKESYQGFKDDVSPIRTAKHEDHLPPIHKKDIMDDDFASTKSILNGF